VCEDCETCEARSPFTEEVLGFMSCVNYKEATVLPAGAVHFIVDAENNIIRRRIKKLVKHVFVFESSRADKKYFEERIFHYLNGKSDFESLSKETWDMVYQRNDEGKTSRYLYFNERMQRLYLDREFWDWVKLTCKLMSSELTKLNNNDETDN
jgi:hypothetical protein